MFLYFWDNLDVFLYSILGAIISIVIKIMQKKFKKMKVNNYQYLYISLGLLIFLPFIIFYWRCFIEIKTPVLKQLSATGFIFEPALSLPPELIALVLALSLYTATFIAECVRAGIQGISKGQKEAAASIGLTPNQVLKVSDNATSFKDNNSTNNKSIFKFNKKFFTSSRNSLSRFSFSFCWNCINANW